MPYRLFGLAPRHRRSRPRRRDRERGQGTVEYVALILLLALVFAAVVKFGAGKDFDIGKTIVDKLKDAIDGVGDAPKALTPRRCAVAGSHPAAALAEGDLRA